MVDDTYRPIDPPPAGTPSGEQLVQQSSTRPLEVQPSSAEGLAIPRPLVISDEAPEVLPDEDQDGSADAANVPPQTSEPHSPSSGHIHDGV